jgi:hypothetical protein
MDAYGDRAGVAARKVRFKKLAPLIRLLSSAGMPRTFLQHRSESEVLFNDHTSAFASSGHAITSDQVREVPDTVAKLF